MEVAGADPEWAVGFWEECWWSRFALPTLNAWAEEGKPPRLIQRSVAKDDPEPKAISCYGLYLPEIDEMWIRFVDGRPVSSVTTRFLSWSLEKLKEIGKKFLVLIWDNAGWHVSKEVRKWLGKHNRDVKESGEGEDRRLPALEAESVAELHRAEVGTRQAQGHRAGGASRSIRACREGVRGIGLDALRAPHR